MEAARPPRRGSRGGLRAAERDGGRVPRPSPHPAVRRSRARRPARWPSTRARGPFTRWCRWTTAPRWWARPSPSASASAATPPARWRPRATSCGSASGWPRRACPARPSPPSRSTEDARGGGPPRALSLRAQAAGALGEPRGDPGRRRGRLRDGLRARGRPPRRSRGAGAGRGDRPDPGGGLRPRRRGGAGGAARGRRPHRARPLRQARSARRAVLRGDHLRDAVAAARGHAARHRGGHRARRPRARPRRTAAARRAAPAPRGATPPSPVVLELAARSIGGLCSRTLRFGTGLTLEDIILRRALDLPIASLEREGARRRRHDDPHPARRRPGDGEGLEAAGGAARGGRDDQRASRRERWCRCPKAIAISASSSRARRRPAAAEQRAPRRPRPLAFVLR